MRVLEAARGKRWLWRAVCAEQDAAFVETEARVVGGLYAPGYPYGQRSPGYNFALGECRYEGVGGKYIHERQMEPSH